MAMHAGHLTRQAQVTPGDSLSPQRLAKWTTGKQSRLLVEFWEEAKEWGLGRPIEYLPRPQV